MNISQKWLFVIIYTIALFIATPYLPNLIQYASSRWSYAGTRHFVLVVEIIIALLILAMGIILLVYRKKRSTLFFLLSMGGILLMSFALYLFLPNPYEFTHLPEYAILGILIMRALDKNRGNDPDSEMIVRKGRSKKRRENIKSGIIKNSYFLSGLITGIIGTGDEIYQHFLPSRFFTWYDVFLNISGGILGLLIYWGMKK